MAVNQQTPRNPPDLYDVVIAGGGMVGASLAYALLEGIDISRPLKVAIVEAVPPQAEDQPSFDSRSVALSRSSVEIFKQLGLWSDVVSHAEPIEHIHVSDRGHLGMSRIHAKDHGLNALGFVVEVQNVGVLLAKSLQKTALNWFTPCNIEKLQQHQDNIELSLSTGETLYTRLLVAADGAQSATRNLLGIQTQQQSYHQSAVIANIRTDKSHHGWAFERFTDTGPVALLPMTDNRYSLVWSVLPEQADSLVVQSDTEFLDSLQRRFGHRAGKFTEVGQRHVYPLGLVHAETLSRHRAVVLGNAAHTLHPIAGQGFNLGLRDIWQLVDQIKRKSVNDPGDFGVLSAFEQAQRQDHQKVIGMTDTLCRVFSNQHLPLVVGRNLGLLCTQLMPSLNDWVAKQGMGKITVP